MKADQTGLVISLVPRVSWADGAARVEKCAWQSCTAPPPSAAASFWPGNTCRAHHSAQTFSPRHQRDDQPCIICLHAISLEPRLKPGGDSASRRVASRQKTGEHQQTVAVGVSFVDLVNPPAPPLHPLLETPTAALAPPLHPLLEMATAALAPPLHPYWKRLLQWPHRNRRAAVGPVEVRHAHPPAWSRTSI